jgi:hypothetical protein
MVGVLWGPWGGGRGEGEVGDVNTRVLSGRRHVFIKPPKPLIHIRLRHSLSPAGLIISSAWKERVFSYVAMPPSRFW